MKPLILTFLTALLVISCKTEINRPISGPRLLYGTWTVDSVVTDSYQDELLTSAITRVEFAHRLDFSLSDKVIENRTGYRDTSVFIQNGPWKAIADLDYNGVRDTINIAWWGGSMVSLNWVSLHENTGSSEFRRVITFYISEQ